MVDYIPAVAMVMYNLICMEPFGCNGDTVVGYNTPGMHSYRRVGNRRTVTSQYVLLNVPLFVEQTSGLSFYLCA